MVESIHVEGRAKKTYYTVKDIGGRKVLPGSRVRPVIYLNA